MGVIYKLKNTMWLQVPKNLTKPKKKGDLELLERWSKLFLKIQTNPKIFSKSSAENPKETCLVCFANMKKNSSRARFEAGTSCSRSTFPDYSDEKMKPVIIRPQVFEISMVISNIRIQIWKSYFSLFVVFYSVPSDTN